MQMAWMSSSHVHTVVHIWVEGRDWSSGQYTHPILACENCHHHHCSCVKTAWMSSLQVLTFFFKYLRTSWWVPCRCTSLFIYENCADVFSVQVCMMRRWSIAVRECLLTCGSPVCRQTSHYISSTCGLMKWIGCVPLQDMSMPTRGPHPCKWPAHEAS